VTATLNLPLPSSPAFLTRCHSRLRLVLLLLFAAAAEAQAFVDGAVLYPPASARQGNPTLRGSDFVRHDQLPAEAND
jgi:hypothetical protein